MTNEEVSDRVLWRTQLDMITVKTLPSITVIVFFFSNIFLTLITVTVFLSLSFIFYYFDYYF